MSEHSPLTASEAYLDAPRKDVPVSRDFDAESRLASKQVTFRLAGEVYQMRRKVRPEAFMAYADMDASDGGTESMAVIDGLVCAFILPDQVERYQRARSYGDDPREQDDDRIIGFADLVALVPWMIEQATGRPPTTPSASS